MAVDWAAVMKAAIVALRDMMNVQLDNGLLFILARMAMTAAVHKKLVAIDMPS
jgi:hypothetical protein